MGLGGIVAGIGAVTPGAPGARRPGGPAPNAPAGTGPAAGGAAVRCANCHARNAAGAKFCSSCGSPLSAPKAAHCTQCGSAVAPNAQILRQLRWGSDPEARPAVKQWLLRVALAAVTLGAAPNVFGRAGGGGHGGGGGGHASGGSFSSGGHGGGGGGSPFGALFVLLIVGLIIWHLYRRNARNRPPGSTPGSPPAANAAARELVGALLGAAAGGALAGTRNGIAPAAVAELSVAVDAIRARDPNFELETFLQRAEMTFYLVKRAISSNDSVAVRPYLNDALYAQIAQMLAQRKAQHRHDLLESLNVRAVHVIHADINAQQQTLLVHFDLVYRGKTLDDAQHVLADEGQDTRHGERWSFVRAAAAVTPAAGGVTASRCPACGAELRLNLDGSCSHCKASVTNGTVDWVVATVGPAAFIGH